jgi:hypothetical protein
MPRDGQISLSNYFDSFILQSQFACKLIVFLIHCVQCRPRNFFHRLCFDGKSQGSILFSFTSYLIQHSDFVFVYDLQLRLDEEVSSTVFSPNEDEPVDEAEALIVAQAAEAAAKVLPHISTI